MKRKPSQLEINWGAPEAFALVPGSTTDGDRIAKENDQRMKDQAQSESLQRDLEDEL